ncbi:MAG: FAD binding domain-containing protein [Anaerolineales bacterium]|nr:FAD binding domain-containing protein [Anaerolineales bacterium]
MDTGFDVWTPKTLPEALGMLADNANAVPFAGGTNVIVNARDGAYRNCQLVDISRLIELDGILLDDEQMVVGAGTKIAELLNSDLVARYGKPLSRAASVFANPLVRNRATLGGNLADASPAADTAPPLLALDAELELVSATSSRLIPINDFFTGVNTTQKRQDELIRSVRWSIQAADKKSAFYKLALRKGSACSVISGSVVLGIDPNGLVESARIAIGAAAIRPIRIVDAENALAGHPLSSDRIDAVAKLVMDQVKPIDDVRSTADYRRKMSGVLVRRMLSGIAKEMEQASNMGEVS